jgi:16S rRNA G966 N2-methylase RsmD
MTILEQTEFEFRKLSSVNNPDSIHGIYPYRGKISAIDAKNLINQIPKSATLLDPFCGSGTILYEARKRGLQAIGIDANPIGLIVSRAKNTCPNEGPSEERVENLISQASKISNRRVAKMPDWSAKYLHAESQDEIMRLLSLKKSMSDFETAAMYGAIALTARGCNHYKWSSNQIGKIIEPLRRIEFYDKFRNKVQKNRKHLIGGKDAIIHQHDTRMLSEVVRPESVDFVYTSPPYFDALDYTSYYSRIIYEMDTDYDRTEIRGDLIQNFSTYSADMKLCLTGIRKALKTGGQAIFVVGDKKTPDGIINGGEFFSTLTDWEPDYVRERGYSGTSSQIWDDVNDTDRKEQIVVWTK